METLVITTQSVLARDEFFILFSRLEGTKQGSTVVQESRVLKLSQRKNTFRNSGETQTGLNQHKNTCEATLTDMLNTQFHLRVNVLSTEFRESNRIFTSGGRAHTKIMT